MHYSLQSLRGDVLGGLMSALVVLTPSVAFGVVAGLDATSGIYAAAAVGLFVGVFERSRPQMGDISSVTAIPMAVVVATYADSLAKALTIVMLAGLMQVALGLLRLARFVAYTPYSVISRLHVRRRRPDHRLDGPLVSRPVRVACQASDGSA